MDDDTDDIYGDLPNFELGKECERLQHEVEDLKVKTDQFSAKIDELTKEKNKLIKQKSILLKNISILLKTAKQELQRKDETILKLRNELQKYLGNQSSRSCDKKELDNLPSEPPNTSTINERLKVLANSNNKVDNAKKMALCELNRESERTTKRDSYRKQNIRERLGPKINQDKRLGYEDRRKSDWRREDIKHRQYEDEKRSDEKPYSNKYSRSHKRYSRSPVKRSRSRSRSRSPCAKRRRTSSSSRSTGRSRLQHSNTPTPKESDVSRHSNSSTHITSVTEENKIVVCEEKRKSIDDSHQVVKEAALRTISPHLSDHGHKENPDKEEGEMSDSDSYEDAIDEPCKIIQAYSKPKKPDEAPKTLFTLRMQQKLRKEDEERKRAMMQAAANQSDHIDATLFDKPKKVTSDKGPVLFSEMFCKTKSDVPAQPPCTKENASKLNEKESSKDSKTDGSKLTKLNKPTIILEPRCAEEPKLDQKDCSKEITDKLLEYSMTANSLSEGSNNFKPVVSSQSTCSQVTELKSDEASKCLNTIKSNESSKGLNEMEHARKPYEMLKCFMNIKPNEFFERIKKINPADLTECLKKAESNVLPECTKTDSNQLTENSQKSDELPNDSKLMKINKLLECVEKINPADLTECLKKAKSNVLPECSKTDSNQLSENNQKCDELPNESKLTKINKPKLHLKINELDEGPNVDSAFNPVLEAKKTLVETFSPFKDNYKLIELSPKLQVKPISFANIPNTNENQNDIGCSEKVINNGNEAEGKQIVGNDPVDNKNSETVSRTERPVIKSPIFNIQKPLKPLSPRDILAVTAVQSSPRKKVSSPSKPESYESCLPKNSSDKSEHERTKENCAIEVKSSAVMNSILPSKSMKSYRIPKKRSCESNKCDHEKPLKANAINDKKREYPTKGSEVKKPRCDVSQKAENRSERKGGGKDFKKSDKPYDVKADKLQRLFNSPSPTEHKTVKGPKSYSDHRKKELTLEKKTENRNVEKSNVHNKLSEKKQTVKTISKKDSDSARSKSQKNSGVKGKTDNRVDCSKTKRTDQKNMSSEKRSSSESVPLTKEKVPDRKSLSRSPHKEVKHSRVKSCMPEKDEKQLKRLEETSENVEGKQNKSPTEAMQEKHIIGSQMSISSPAKAPVLTPKDNCCDISYNTYRLDEPPPTPDIPYSLLSELAREKEDSRKNERLVSKLGLDLVESPLIGAEKADISLSRPITPDIPREFQTSLELSEKSQGKANSASEKRSDNSSSADRSGDIANFEIFKSVNMNNTSSSLDHSKDSKSSTRLQRDLSLSDTDSESEDDGSCSSNSDSEASDIMDMFD